MSDIPVSGRAELPRVTAVGPRLLPAALSELDGGTALRHAGRLLGMLGVAAALFLLFELFGTALLHDRVQRGLLAEFQRTIPTTTLGAPDQVPPEGSAVAILTIPRLGVDEVVVEGTSPQDLTGGPGHLRDSPLPGEYGNAVIAGRRTTYGGPFRALDELRDGDVINVTTGQGAFMYLVSTVSHVDAGQADALDASKDSRLTLTTSDPAFLPSGRLVANARLYGLPVAVPTRSTAGVDASDLGLAFSPLWLGVTLLCVQGIVAALWLNRRLRPRWPLSVRAMYLVPVLLALTLLAFGTADRVLPGMM